MSTTRVVDQFKSSFAPKKLDVLRYADKDGFWHFCGNPLGEKCFDNEKLHLSIDPEYFLMVRPQLECLLEQAICDKVINQFKYVDWDVLHKEIHQHQKNLDAMNENDQDFEVTLLYLKQRLRYQHLPFTIYFNRGEINIEKLVLLIQKIQEILKAVPPGNKDHLCKSDIFDWQSKQYPNIGYRVCYANKMMFSAFDIIAELSYQAGKRSLIFQTIDNALLLADKNQIKEVNYKLSRDQFWHNYHNKCVSSGIYKLHVSIDPQHFMSVLPMLKILLTSAAKKNHITGFKVLATEKHNEDLRQTEADIKTATETSDKGTSELQELIVIRKDRLRHQQLSFTIYLPIESEINFSAIAELCWNIQLALENIAPGAPENNCPSDVFAWQSNQYPNISFRTDNLSSEYVYAFDDKSETVREAAVSSDYFKALDRALLKEAQKNKSYQVSGAIFDIDSIIIPRSTSEVYVATPYADYGFRFLKNKKIPLVVVSEMDEMTVRDMLKETGHRLPVTKAVASDQPGTGLNTPIISEAAQHFKLPDTDMHKVIFFTDSIGAIKKIQESKLDVWIVGLSGYSAHTKISTLEEIEEMKPEVLVAKRKMAAHMLEQAGAHKVVLTLAEMPAVIESIDRLIEAGIKPGTYDQKKSVGWAKQSVPTANKS